MAKNNEMDAGIPMVKQKVNDIGELMSPDTKMQRRHDAESLTTAKSVETNDKQTKSTSKDKVSTRT